MAAEVAGKRFDIYLQNTPLRPAYQPYTPIPWLIRVYFIESIVSRTFTARRSLRVDGLFIFAEFLEGCGNGWN